MGSKNGRLDLKSLMKGRVIIITGANTGIGFAAAKALVAKGAHVIIGCRDAAKAEEALKQLGPRAEALSLDLQSFESVNAFADAFLAKKIPLHVLINNAGIFGPKTVELKEGFELSFLTNHLGHFLLTQRLLGALLAAKGKVINVASKAHFFFPRPFDPDLAVGKNYEALPAYGMSKLANIFHASELARRYGDKVIADETFSCRLRLLTVLFRLAGSPCVLVASRDC